MKSFPLETKDVNAPNGFIYYNTHFITLNLILKNIKMKSFKRILILYYKTNNNNLCKILQLIS